jgi:hypothetical protein
MKKPQLAKDLLAKALAAVGLRVLRSRGRYAEDGLFTVHNDHFRFNPSFRAAYARGLKAANGVDPRFEWRVHVALWAAKSSLRVAGDFVECGVNAGFISSAIMQRLGWNSVNRNYYLVDTFRGPPLSQYSDIEVQQGRRQLAENALSAGAYVVDLERVRNNFAEWRNVTIVQGAIPDILTTISTPQVAFLHIDLNSAYPEKAALRFFWDKLAPGSIVLLDDYAYHGYGEQAAAISQLGEEEGFEVLSIPTGQGLIIR